MQSLHRVRVTQEAVATTMNPTAATSAQQTELVGVAHQRSARTWQSRPLRRSHPSPAWWAFPAWRVEAARAVSKTMLTAKTNSWRDCFVRPRDAARWPRCAISRCPEIPLCPCCRLERYRRALTILHGQSRRRGIRSPRLLLPPPHACWPTACARRALRFRPRVAAASCWALRPPPRRHCRSRTLRRWRWRPHTMPPRPGEAALRRFP